MQADIDRVLVPRDTIAQRVRDVAEQIRRDLWPDGPRDALSHHGSRENTPEVTLIPILTGSFIFVADLIRELPLYMQIRLLSVSSYPGKATSSRGAKIGKELTNLPDSLEGSHVLLIDDILDSGSTLKLARDVLADKMPDSIRTCVLLRKQRPEAMVTPVDYVCFDIPDEFVVGYGLDYDDYYRNLPDIVTLRPEVVRGE